jgi:SAM-dependent methyltransferase
MLNGNRTKSNRGRRPRDLYITPSELALEAMIRLRDEELTEPETLVALDAGCGTGIWGLVTYEWFHILEGIDINPNVEKKYYYRIFTEDYLKFHPNGYEYDFIFGNPPYSLAEEFIRHSFDLLSFGGHIYFLLRLAFLEGTARGKGLFTEFPPKRVYVCSRRPSFFSTNGKHTTDTLAYAMFLWQKGYKESPQVSWINWEYKKD